MINPWGAERRTKKIADKYLFASFKQLATPSYIKEDNSKSRITYELIRIFLSGILCFIIIQFFVKGLFFSTGVTGISLIFADFAQSYSPKVTDEYSSFILYGGFFIINIPLFFYAWSRLERILFWYSLAYTIIFASAGIIFNVVYDRFSSGNASLIFPFASALTAKIENFISNNPLSNGDFSNIPGAFWGYIAVSLVLATIGGILFGIGLSITYSSRGTTGGTDLPIIYYSITKGKNLGRLNFYVNSSIVLFGTIFLFFHDQLRTQWHYNFLQYLTSYKTLGTVIYIICYSISLDIFFPRGKKVQMQIVTSKANEIANQLFTQKNFTHSFTKVQAEGMYKKTKCEIMYCTITYFEYLRFASYIKTIDPDVFCSASFVTSVVGNFNNPKNFN